MPSPSRQHALTWVLRPTLRILPLSIAFSLLFARSGAGQPRFFENGDSLYRGPDAGYLLDTPTRIKIDLSGPWTYSLDGHAEGVVRIPAAFDYAGTMTFQRSFSLTQELLDRYAFHIVMLGEHYSADVSVNGEFIASREGGYSGILEPIPGNALQPGSANILRVVVNNKLSPKLTLPLRPSVWGIRNDGGILRDVFLLGTPKLYLRNAVLRTDLTENLQTARISVRFSAEGEDSTTVAER